MRQVYQDTHRSEIKSKGDKLGAKYTLLWSESSLYYNIEVHYERMILQSCLQYLGMRSNFAASGRSDYYDG